MEDSGLTMIEVKVEPGDRTPTWWLAPSGSTRSRGAWSGPATSRLDLRPRAHGAGRCGRRARLLKPITAEIEYVTVEYSLHEFRYWLPRRFAREGEATVGRFLEIPLTVEWTVTGYVVNEEESELPIAGPLPPGWTRAEHRRDRDGEVSYVTVLMPPTDSLVNSPDLSEATVDRAPHRLQ